MANGYKMIDDKLIQLTDAEQKDLIIEIKLGQTDKLIDI